MTTETPEQAVQTKSRRPFGVADGVCLLVLAALLLFFLLIVPVPALLGLTPYAVASDSMEPTLSRGDLIFVRPATLGDVAEGNVIVFQYDGSVMTHRVWSVEAGGDALRTRADASPSLDPFLVTGEELVGRAVYKLPLLGYLNLWREGTA